MRHDLPNDQTCTSPGTIQEDSPKILHHTVGTGDIIVTDHYMEPNAKTSTEQLSLPILILAVHNMIYVTVLNRIAMTTTDIKLQTCLGMVPGKTTYTIRELWEKATERLRGTYVPIHKTPSTSCGTVSEC